MCIDYSWCSVLLWLVSENEILREGNVSLEILRDKLKTRVLDLEEELRRLRDELEHSLTYRETKNADDEVFKDCWYSIIFIFFYTITLLLVNCFVIIIICHIPLRSNWIFEKWNHRKIRWGWNFVIWLHICFLAVGLWGKLLDNAVLLLAAPNKYKIILNRMNSVFVTEFTL